MNVSVDNNNSENNNSFTNDDNEYLSKSNDKIKNFIIFLHLIDKNTEN